MTNKFTLPPGPIARKIEGIMVCICGLGSFLVYALIEFGLCAINDCKKLEITKFYASLPEFYLAYGVACIVTGVFLYTNREAGRAFRLGIESAILVGFVLSGMIAFGMLIEIKNVT